MKKLKDTIEGIEEYIINQQKKQEELIELFEKEKKPNEKKKIEKLIEMNIDATFFAQDKYMKLMKLIGGFNKSPATDEQSQKFQPK